MYMRRIQKRINISHLFSIVPTKILRVQRDKIKSTANGTAKSGDREKYFFVSTNSNNVLNKKIISKENEI